ncbi:MAG: cell division protein SepF [Clostridia bacterium]|nr:cell division protein SepF [Clostridia bacterium]
MKKDWLKKIKTEPAADVDTDYDQDYYSYGNAESATAAKAAEDKSGLYNEFEDDDISGVRIVMSEDPAKEVAKAEVLLKRTFTPQTCHDSQAIVDALKDGRVVVICVEELDKSNFVRMFDYVMGAAHALDANLNRLDRDTVLILPYNVDEDISVDDLEEEILPAEEEGTDGADS